MTVSIDFTVVPNSIAALTVTGVTIKDIDQIPAGGLEMLVPILFPDPGGWLANVENTFDSFGSGGAQKQTLGYSLNYIYLHAPAGTGITDFETFNALITKLGLILTAIANNDVLTGADDIKIERVDNPAYIEAPDGTIFHGCRCAFRVSQMLN